MAPLTHLVLITGYKTCTI